MLRFKDGLKGNLSIPVKNQEPDSVYQTFPLTAFHRRDEKGNLKITPDPSAAARGRNFDIENKK